MSAVWADAVDTPQRRMVRMARAERQRVHGGVMESLPDELDPRRPASHFSVSAGHPGNWLFREMPGQGAESTRRYHPHDPNNQDSFRPGVISPVKAATATFRIALSTSRPRAPTPAGIFHSGRAGQR